jgi:gliding motility-associated-like protein
VAGFYKVLLTMTSNYNCTDTVSKWIKITEQPVVSFTTNQVSSCFRDNLFETDNLSVYNGTELVNYFWKFSDGTTSKLFSPKKSFTTSGQKNITLVGITTEGCADSSVKTITVFPQGKSAIQLLDTIQCLRANKFTFGNLSRIEGEKFALLSWSFGDGTIDTVLTVRPVTYEYNDTGYFRVELTTTSENLCEDKSFGFVRVVPMPDANFTQSSNSYCENDQKFEFIAGKTPSNIILKKWELEKKTIFGIDTLKFKFALPGKYKVNYILQTNYGCGDTAVSKVIVNEAPIAQILSDKIEQCLESNKFYFTNLSSGNSIPDESWIFHDGPYLDLRTGSSQEVVYEYAGKQLVELIVENDSACIDTASTFITVNPFPKANISIPNVCQNTPSIIRANATISSGKINSYEWNLGDGRNTIDSTPIHQYVNYGKYFINLTLRSDKGCFSKFIDSTIIYPKPIARIVVLTPRASILKDTIAFMDSSDNAETYEWNFGDLQGSTSYDMYPKNRYLDTGNFKVQLVVTSSDGCVDTAYKVVRVWPDFNLLFPTAFSPNNDGINDDYNVVGHFHSIKDFSMSIFDQNGLKVFETIDINEAWNGTLMNQGIALPSANYEVIVRVRDLYNKQFSFTKKISLIR